MNLQMGMIPRLEQRLKMTAQMIQSIQMLQVPLMQLQQEVNQHLVENPVLELEEEEIEREVDAGTDLDRGAHHCWVFHCGEFRERIQREVDLP